MSTLSAQRLPHPARIAAASIAAIGLVSLVTQFVLAQRNLSADMGALAVTVHFLSYFTVLSNLLVAAVTLSAAWPAAGGRGFDRPAVRGAAALYIAVTGLVYATVLAPILHLTGLHWYTDIGMHYLVPPLYVAWWLLATPHGRLGRGELGRWLVFPIAYLGWTFARGQVVHLYPYPFVDVGLHGWPVVLRNCLAMTAVFVVVGVVLVLVDRALGRAKR